MSPTDLADLFDNAAGPLQLTLASGDRILVDNPKRTIIEGLTAYIGQADAAEDRLARRVRWVSIQNITLVKKADPRLLNGRHRRR
jgi:hypothetical protein